MSDDDNDDLNSKVAVLLTGVGAAAVVATIYHCLVMTWCCRHRARPNPQEPQLYVNETILENSTAQPIPSYEYRKDTGLTGDNGTCAVCLGDFEEGEQLR